MAVLTGLLLAQPSHGDGNAHLASIPALTPWINPGPISALAGAMTSAGALVRVSALAHPRPLAGELLSSYFDDYYYRVHLIPASIDLGNLVTAQSRAIDVWNAWPDLALSMTDLVIAGGDGITVTGDNTRPLPFAPLQQRSWDIAVTADGPPVIDATLSWAFAAQPSVSVVITGNRLTAWLVPPDWSRAGITETLQWLTDPQQAVDGSSERVVLRETPRRQWEFDTVAEGRERRLIEATLYDWRARHWALPIWAEISLLDVPLDAGAQSIPIDTTGLDFTVGGLIMLWRDPYTYELAEIADVQPAVLTLSHPTAAAWPAATRVYPCRTAKLTDTPKLTRKSSNQITSTVRFESVEPCEWPAVAPATLYLGIPVLEDRIEESNDPAATFDRQLVVLDNDVGLDGLDDLTGIAWPTQSHAWKPYGRAERAMLRSRLYWLQGRANALWLPSWVDDMTLVAQVASNVTVLTIEHANVSRFLLDRPGRRHLRLELLDGTVLYRAVLDAVELDAQTEQLSIDSVTGIAFDPSAVRQISWMMLATLASDTVDIVHIDDSMGWASCGANFAGVVAEEP